MNLIIRPAISLFILLAILVGVIYPLIVTGLGDVLFPHQVHGSLLSKNGQVIGSALIGQNFTSPGYFWGRPSATDDFPYNPLSSRGSQFGPSNPLLIQTVAARVALLRKFSSNPRQPAPVDLVTASASGLDPEISLAAALYQTDRIARIRHLPVEKLDKLVDTVAEKRQLGLLGEPRVNVLKLNLALDELSQSTHSTKR